MIFKIRNINRKPWILPGCDWIVEPENPKQLAETIQYVFDHLAETKEKGKKHAKNVRRNIAGK